MRREPDDPKYWGARRTEIEEYEKQQRAMREPQGKWSGGEQGGGEYGYNSKGGKVLGTIVFLAAVIMAIYWFGGSIFGRDSSEDARTKSPPTLTLAGELELPYVEKLIEAMKLGDAAEFAMQVSLAKREFGPNWTLNLYESQYSSTRNRNTAVLVMQR